MNKIAADENLEDILDYEKIRYRKKGYGLISAIAIFLAFFFILPHILNYVYPMVYQENKGNPGIFALYYIFTVHESSFIIINFIFWAIYKLEWNFFERYKINDKSWPWKEDPEGWNKMLKSTIITLFINQCIILPLSMIPYIIKGQSPYRLDTETLPTPWEIIWQIVFFMICEDFTFYWSHRVLHMDFIYPRIHKMHHRYVNCVSIASEYAHPVEFLFGNLLTSSSGALILGNRTHLVTYTMWLILRIGETSDGHSGYEFSWSPYRLLPFSGSSEFHNYHHINYKGNYGSFFTIWDRVCKTVNKRYIEFHNKKAQLILERNDDIKKTK